MELYQFALGLVLTLTSLYHATDAGVTSKDIASELNDLQQKVNILQVKLEELETQNNDQRTRILTLETYLEVFSNSCECGNTDGSESSRRVRRSVSSDMVAFYATVRKYAIPNVFPFQNIVFDEVITNVGDPYNPEYGVFMAPVNGTYVLSVTLSAELTSSNVTEFYAFINAAGKNVARIVGHNRQQSTQMVVVELNQGDMVMVMNSQGPFTVLGSLYTSIAGFLLPEPEMDMP